MKQPSEIEGEGRAARDADIPDFLCPYWQPDIATVGQHDAATQQQIRAWWKGWEARDIEITARPHLGTIIDLIARYNKRLDLLALGRGISICDSQEGFPAETAFQHLEATKPLTADEKAVVMFWYTVETMQHRRKSGISWKRHRALQEQNCTLVVEVLNTGRFSSVYHCLT